MSTSRLVYLTATATTLWVDYVLAVAGVWQFEMFDSAIVATIALAAWPILKKHFEALD